MSGSSTTRRARVGLISLGAGLAAAGLGAALGVAAERMFGRSDDPGPGEGDLDGAGSDRAGPGAAGSDGAGADGAGGGAGHGANGGAAPAGPAYGSLHGRTLTVPADDGTPLHVEIDECAGSDGAAGSDRAAGTAGATIVFAHGFALTLDAWHFQRAALRGTHRLVFADQRGHGRSGDGAEGSSSIEQAGRDLGSVIDAVAPEGSLVLVAHSMGGMALLALAEQRPQLFAGRVVAVALIATSSGAMDDVDFGIANLGRLIRSVGPGALRLLSRAPRTVGYARRLVSELEEVFVRRYSFASDVPPALVHFVARMIVGTRLDVIADFLPTFSGHDKGAVLRTVLDGIDVLVLVGDHDLLTPLEHSEQIAAALPGSQLVVVRHAGHLVMLEHPDIVNAALRELLDRAGRIGPGPGRVARTVTPLRPRDGGRRPAEGGCRGPAERCRGAAGGRHGMTVCAIARLDVPTPEAMRGLGRRLAGLLRAGDLVLLIGDLGAGKTTLARGIGEGLGVRGEVTSPTFVIAREHPGTDGRPALVHVDAYRLGGLAEVDDLDLDSAVEDSVTVVEWGVGLVEELTESRLEVRLTRSRGTAGDPIGAPEPARTVEIVGIGPRWTGTTGAGMAGTGTTGTGTV